MKITFTILIFLFSQLIYCQQNFPWERPLKIATSNDGVSFFNSQIFQDSAGVPSAVKWKGDTLVCLFQWFRVPQNSNTWDKVAVKFSFDNGITWTEPTPIVINNFPPLFQRPFDPAIAVINADSLRVYFSSSNGMPSQGIDSTINTYSASTTDGINYTFEPNARFDHPTNRVIDPSVIVFKNGWQYCAPAGAPQDGAYHCTSINGIDFTRHADIISDINHNWTGNFMTIDTNEIRFYSSGQHIWYNSSSDGNNWNGYVNTNLTGGDPSAVLTGNLSYIIIYTGEPYLNFIDEDIDMVNNIIFHQGTGLISVPGVENEEYCILSYLGQNIKSGIVKNESIFITDLTPGIYFVEIKGKRFSRIKFFKE